MANPPRTTDYLAIAMPRPHHEWFAPNIPMFDPIDMWCDPSIAMLDLTSDQYDRSIGSVRSYR